MVGSRANQKLGEPTHGPLVQPSSTNFPLLIKKTT